MRTLGLTILLLVLLDIPLSTAGARAQESAPRLEVSQLNVEPRFVRGKGIVTVEAVIVNRGDAPVHSLQLGVAIAGTNSPDDWTPLDKSHPEPIITILPGEEVRFRETINLNASGTFQVGVAGLAANAFLSPVGQTVRVIQPANMLTNTAILLVIYVCLIGSGWLILGKLLRCQAPLLRQNFTLGLRRNSIISSTHMARTNTQPSQGQVPLFKPDKRALVAALAFMLLAPSLLATFIPVGRARISPETLWAIPTAVGLFVAGWLLLGATLRPYGSPWRGILIAAVLYVLIGALWVVGFTTAMGTPVFERSPRTILGGTLLWPLGVAQVLGLFGLELG